MLHAVRRWFSPEGRLPSWTEFSAWAQENHWTLKRTIAHDGWAMEHPSRHAGWRIEWGPAQRAFMGSREFRIRLEVADLPDMQALVLDSPLLARLDREVYQQFTDTVQTRLDEEAPEEMRWLAIHPRLSPNQMGVALRDRYGAIADDPDRLSQWLDGSLSAALKGRANALPIEAVASEPFMLRLARGQVLLRQAAPLPRVDMLGACVAVAEAAEQALRTSA